jgi:uncharacterized protein YacL
MKRLRINFERSCHYITKPKTNKAEKRKEERLKISSKAKKDPKKKIGQAQNRVKKSKKPIIDTIFRVYGRSPEIIISSFYSYG